jgi:hypothetical protein
MIFFLLLAVVLSALLGSPEIAAIILIIGVLGGLGLAALGGV